MRTHVRRLPARPLPARAPLDPVAHKGAVRPEVRPDGGPQNCASPRMGSRIWVGSTALAACPHSCPSAHLPRGTRPPCRPRPKAHRGRPVSATMGGHHRTQPIDPVMLERSGMLAKRITSRTKKVQKRSYTEPSLSATGDDARMIRGAAGHPGSHGSGPNIGAAEDPTPALAGRIPAPNRPVRRPKLRPRRSRPERQPRGRPGAPRKCRWSHGTGNQ